MANQLAPVHAALQRNADLLSTRTAQLAAQSVAYAAVGEKMCRHGDDLTALEDTLTRVEAGWDEALAILQAYVAQQAQLGAIQHDA